MHPGDIIAGKYRVARILGRSRGLLLEARHTEFDKRVVIRLLSPALCDEKQLEQFRREARTLAKLESEHVARIIDVGTHSDGSFYLVREHLEGTDLGAVLQSRGALTCDEALLYVLQVGEAVQECHSHNIILRELQPSHLFLTRRRGGGGMVKIIDFGTAKLLKDQAGQAIDGEMSATVMFGMSRYSSPELVRKVGTIDGRTDVWSLGCILYELLAAVPPFSGEMAELMYRITQHDPIPLSRLRPDLPRDIDQIMGWALAKDPDARFGSVYALAHALKQYVAAEGQVLIDRIGHLAHSIPDHAGDAGPHISPTSPLSKGLVAALEAGDGAATVLLSPPPAEESPFERRAYLSPDMDLASERSSHAPPPPRQRYSSAGFGAPRPSERGLADNHTTAGVVSPSTATGGYPAQSATGHHQRVRQRQMAVVAFGASLVVVPMLVMLLVFVLRDSPPAPVATVASASTAAPKVDQADDPEDDELDEPDESARRDTGSGAGDDVPTPRPDDSAAPARKPGPTATPASTARERGDDNPFAKKDDKKSDRKVAKKDDKKSPPKDDDRKKDDGKGKSGGSTGTLVAVAVGGSCSFTVDGASKGTTSSIKVTVPVGSHTVSCAAPGGPVRTKSVTVQVNKPGMAMFKLGGS